MAAGELPLTQRFSKRQYEGERFGTEQFEENDLEQRFEKQEEKLSAAPCVQDLWPEASEKAAVSFNAEFVEREGRKAVKEGYLRMQVSQSVLSTFENGADLNRKHA